MAFAELAAPVGFLENLVYQQHLSAALIEFTGEIGNAASLEIEVVHVDIQALTVVYVEILLCVLKKEGGFSHATCPLDADHTVVPVDFIHQESAYRSVRMFHQIGVRAKKGFHHFFVCFIKRLQRY